MKPALLVIVLTLLSACNPGPDAGSSANKVIDGANEHRQNLA